MRFITIKLNSNKFKKYEIFKSYGSARELLILDVIDPVDYGTNYVVYPINKYKYKIINILYIWFIKFNFKTQLWVEN